MTRKLPYFREKITKAGFLPSISSTSDFDFGQIGGMLFCPSSLFSICIAVFVFLSLFVLVGKSRRT